MQFITQYLYRQTIPCQIVELLDTNRRTVSVYNRDIKAYRGVANKFLIEIKNQDQKPINISDRTIKLNVLNPETNSVYSTTTAIIHNASKGQALVTLDDNNLLDLPATYYNYTVAVTSGEGTDEIAYADDNYGVRGTLQVLDGHYPTFTASTELTVNADSNVTSYVISDKSSNQGSKLHTAAFYLSNYTGNILIEGTLDDTPNYASANYFTVQTKTYASATGTYYATWTGNYRAVRFTQVKTSGSITKILYRG